jgi:hypothetical protein
VNRVIRHVPAVRLTLVASALAFASGCGTGLPGTPMGTYGVTATQSTNTCGGGLGAPSSYEFFVALSTSGSTLYWSWQDNQPISSGTLSPVTLGGTQLQATLTASESGNVDPTDAGAGACNMSRADTLQVVLPSKTAPAAFTGTLSYTFEPAAGADCSDQLVASGGSYAQLPCEVEFSLAAARK